MGSTGKISMTTGSAASGSGGYISIAVGKENLRKLAGFTNPTSTCLWGK